MTINIADLPEQERNAIERDKLTALWAHNCKSGRNNQASVVRRINAIADDNKRQDLLSRFDRFMNA